MSKVKKQCERCGKKEKLYVWDFCGDCLRELTRGGHWID